jgi:hypothetical protein
MAALGWTVMITGFIVVAVLGLRWTRPAPGTRRLHPLEEPGELDPRKKRDRLQADATMWWPR